MLYLETENLPVIFNLVRTYYGRNEEVPAYEIYAENVAKLLGVLAGVKNNTFYPSIAQKAAYLFLQINKGHLPVLDSETVSEIRHVSELSRLFPRRVRAL